MVGLQGHSRSRPECVTPLNKPIQGTLEKRDRTHVTVDDGFPTSTRSHENAVDVKELVLLEFFVVTINMVHKLADYLICDRLFDGGIAHNRMSDNRLTGVYLE